MAVFCLKNQFSMREYRVLVKFPGPQVLIVSTEELDLSTLL